MTPPFDAIAARWLSPTRSGLTVARTVVGTATDATEAWERLIAAGLLPEDWASSPTRRFHTLRPAAGPHRYGNCGVPCLCDPRNLRERPSRVHDAVLFASDIEGMRQAEALAREGRRRLRPWTAEDLPDRVVWAASRGSRRLRSFNLVGILSVRIKVQKALDDCGDRTFFDAMGHYSAELTRVIRETANPALKRFHAVSLADLLALAESFRRACALGLDVPEGFITRIPAEGRPFAELPNPFVPWWALLQTGYAPWVVTQDTVMLAAPGLDERRSVMAVAALSRVER